MSIFNELKNKWIVAKSEDDYVKAELVLLDAVQLLSEEDYRRLKTDVVGHPKQCENIYIYPSAGDYPLIGHCGGIEDEC